MAHEKPKVKWPVRELMVKRQQRLLKRWLRYAEDLRATEEEMICYCWPETGKSLDDWDELGSTDDLKHCRLGRKEEIPVSQEGNRLRSVEGLKDCREDSQGISNCQLGKETEMRSAEDLMDCQEDNEETLHCQLGNERRSDEDLEDCQEGSGKHVKLLNCQVGRDEQLRPSEGSWRIQFSRGC
jgi:hypothetical protein